MPRPTVVMIVVVVLAVGTSCAQTGARIADSPPAPLPSASSVKPCPFEVGDIVRRAGGGAAVPPPGQGVVGNFDGVEKSGSIQVDTSTDGLVTITSQVSGQPEHVETCQLPGV